MTTRYVHGPGIDEPLLVEEGGQVYAVHADALGSVTGLSDASQTLNETSTYTSFGELSRAEAVAANPYAYTGREWERELALYYYRARYYDPEAGRFLSRDPIGFAGGDANLYAYVLGDPTNVSDPAGLEVLLCRRVANLPGNQVFKVEHHWLKTSTQEAGLGRVGGGVPGHGGSDYPGVPVTLNDHSGQYLLPDVVCAPVDTVTEACVNAELSKSGTRGRWWPWNQCQSVVADIIRTCEDSAAWTPKQPYGNYGRVWAEP